MTRFGKILVLFNLMLSLVFASWALAVYMLRADPTDTVAVSSAESPKRVHITNDKAVQSGTNTDVAKVEPDRQDRSVVVITGLKEGRMRANVGVDGKTVGFDVTVDQGAPGELTPRREEIERLQTLTAQAEDQWLAAYNELKALEKQRPLDQEWYRQKLQLLDGDEPVETVAYNKGEAQIDAKTGLPELKKMVPELRGRSYYLKQIEQTQGQIQETRAKIGAQVVEQQQLTDALKGIRRDLAGEVDKLRKVREEREYLDPLLYNHVGEAQVVVDRQQRLQARIIELSLGLTLDRNTTTVATVSPKGPAARAGIQAGDVLTAVAGAALVGETATPRNVVKALFPAHNPGDRIPVGIRRGGKDVKLDVELGGATRLQ
jgi:hypothetical protein